MSEKKQDDIFSPEPYHVEYIDKDQGVIDQDAVFGEITEEGPNYRNVRASSNNMRYYSELTIPLGRMARDHGPHDEDPNRSRSSFDTVSLRHPRSDPGSHSPLRYCCYYNVVGLYCGCL